MDPYLTYDLFRSRMDNECTRRLITESKDIGIVVDSEDAKQHLIFLIRLLDEWNSVRDSIKSFTIVVPDKKARAPFEKIDKSILAEHPSFQYVKRTELKYPETLLTIAIVDTIDINLWNDIHAYGIATVTNENGTVMTRDSLTALKFQQVESIQGTNYSESCKTRKEYYQKLMDGRYHKAAFMQCLEELRNGCQTCPDCPNYKTGDPCPFFQKKIADFYENGIFVPANPKLAFQWKRKAARKGLQEAELSLAESYKDGTGCQKDIDAALSIYIKFAKKGSEDAARELVSLALESKGYEQSALPWMARLANAGDFPMQTKLIDIYSSGLYGIPVNAKEQDKWTTIASDSGNIEYVDRLIEACKERKDWQGAIHWYGKLRDSDSFVENDVLGFVDQLCIDTDMNAEEMVSLADKYYWGFGVDESGLVAFHLYSKAYDIDSEVGAEGLGRCYYYGKGVTESKNEAIGYWVDAADAGNISAMVRLFNHYYQEDNQSAPAEYRRKEAVIALDNAVKYEDPVALRWKSLGLMKGDLYEQNKELAFELLNRAAELGDIWALFHLGRYYIIGVGVPEDKVKAFSFFEKAAQKGLCAAQYSVGISYLTGRGVNRDYKLAFDWLMKAAKRGHTNACYNVGLLYELGKGIAKNVKLSSQWYLKAAELGHARAQAKIGESYFHGIGVEKDFALSKKWSVLSAEQGDESAYFRAAYLCTIKIEGKTDYPKAFKWYTILADKGGIAAKNNLGVLYANGDGVEKDPEKASQLYLEAAQGGDKVAMDNIATRYLHGTGIEQNLEEALTWYEKALDAGNLESGINLAKEFLSGEYFEKDVQKTIDYYKKVIEQPHNSESQIKQYTRALIDLANLYFYGKEVETDDAEAFRLYTIAAECGSTIAYVRLGDIYQFGYHVAIDIDRAIYWYRLAAEKNDKDAKEKLDDLGVDYLGKKPKTAPEIKDDLPF